MIEYEDETHALISAVEALCFALRAKQSAVMSLHGGQSRAEADRLKDMLRDTRPINQPGGEK